MLGRAGPIEAASTPVFSVDGARATIRLNRPRHVNRIQAEDLKALLALFDRVEADPAIRVLKVGLKDAQYWDSPGTAMSYIKMAAAALTNTRPDVGKSAKVRM